MKSWKMVLVGLALSALAGCRTDPAVPILERELRLKEDEIYRLRAALEGTQDCDSSWSDKVADDFRSTPPEARGAGPASGSRRRQSDSDRPGGIMSLDVQMGTESSDTAPPSLNPDRNLPDDRFNLPEDRFKKPSTDPGPNDTDGPRLEGDSDRSSSRRNRITPASRSASARAFLPSGDSREVASIALDRTLTGGISADGGDGDQGLLVVVEPRDREGRSVDAPAEMSVVVIDPALEGDAARVARWDFTPAETVSMFRRTGAGSAIHLTTAWPGDPPAHNRLHLFVRYVTLDGRKLQADQPIEVALTGDRTARWNHNDRPADRAAPESQRPDAPQSTAPRVATRPAEPPKPRRPVWSPERR